MMKERIKTIYTYILGFCMVPEYVINDDGADLYFRHVAGFIHHKFYLRPDEIKSSICIDD